MSPQFPLRPIHLALLSLGLLAGCASQDALEERTEPMRQQLTQLEQSVQGASESARRAQAQAAAAQAALAAKADADIAGHCDALTAEVRALQAGLAAQQARAEQAERRLDLLAEQGRQARGQAEAGQVDTTNRVAALASRLDGDEQRLSALSGELRGAQNKQQGQADRLSQVEQRVDALAEQGRATANGLAGVGERQAGQDSRVAAVEQRLATLESGDGAAAGRLATLDARVARLEQGLSETATDLRRQADALAAQAATQGRQDVRLNEQAARVAAGQAKLDALADRQAAQAGDFAEMAKRLNQDEQRLDKLAGDMREALSLLKQESIRSHGKVKFNVVLTEDKTLYPINAPELGERDRAALADLVSQLKAMHEDYHLEIQGHTDNLGSDDYNYQLGWARAEVVKRYLHEKLGQPLNWMSVISYGASNPVAAYGQSNRRIVIQVMVLAQ